MNEQSAYRVARRRASRPWMILRSLAAVVRDPEDTASGARLVLACEGKRAEQNFQRFAADSRGARILAGGTSLFDLLSDRDALRKLPTDSLGRSYLAFVEREGISTEALQSIVAPVEAELFDPGPGHERYGDHMSAMHDLWHVVTGYSRDILGELLLLAFTHEQIGTRAFGWIVKAASLGIDRRIPGAKALLQQSRARAGRAPWLLTADWETLLHLPLEEVRTTLKLGPAPDYVRHIRNPHGFGLIPEQTPA